MSIRDHRKFDGICIWDHETWPCEAVQQFDQHCDEILDALDVVAPGDYTAVLTFTDAIRHLSPME